MVGLQETSAALYGAWRLARLDPQGLAYFDASERGFWRSFWAAVFVAPAYALIVMLGGADDPTPPDPLRVLLVEGIAYVIGWAAFPLAMIGLADKLNRRGQYFRYVVANNWAAVIEMTLFLPAVALAADNAQLAPLPVIAALLIFAYKWTVARFALALDPLPAALPVILSFAIGMALGAVTRLLLNAPA